MRPLLSLLRSAPAIAIAGFAGVAWYLAATRISFRLGVEEAAPVIGVLTGLAIALTLWRSSAAETARANLARLVCPRCGARLEAHHEHAGAEQPGGLTAWTCARCAYAHAEALTCEACRP